MSAQKIKKENEAHYF